MRSIATATSRKANSSDTASCEIRCWSAVPARTPPIAGIPISTPLRTSTFPSIPLPAAGRSAIEALVDPLRAAPASAAVLSDLDGTLAPIVPDPRAAAVPDEARELLDRLAGRYALVACVTGRRALDARRIVGSGAIVYAGNHGLELLEPGRAEPTPAAAVAGQAGAARDFVDALDGDDIAAAGLAIEDK